MPLLSGISSKNIFLVDAIGALVSAFFLGVILVRFNSLVGMPLNTLYFLAVLPCIFAVYSFYCYFFVKDNYRPYMQGIAVANLLYCFITLGLVIFHFKSLAILGLLYFCIELIIIGWLISYELNA